MRILHRISQIGILLAVFVFIMTFPVRSHYAERAEFALRIERNNADSLFGSAGTPLGEPQVYIVEDPKAFLPGEGAEGAKLLDENYLKAHNIYPLQLQTVDFFASYTRLGCLAAIPVFWLVAWWASSRLRKRNPEPSPVSAS